MQKIIKIYVYEKNLCKSAILNFFVCM